VLFADLALADWQITDGVDPGYTVQDGLETAKGLEFHAHCVGRDDNGFLPDDTTDEGFLVLDDIEFF
jgi:hypothetical protein